MNLNLTRPLIFFDTETTGVNIVKDRIVELGAIKIYPDGTRETYYQRFNPGIPIEPGATKVHKITDEMVAHEPPFSDKDVLPRHEAKNPEPSAFCRRYGKGKGP